MRGRIRAKEVRGRIREREVRGRIREKEGKIGKEAEREEGERKGTQRRYGREGRRKRRGGGRMNETELGWSDSECRGFMQADLWSEKDPGLPSGLRAPAVQNMAVVSRSPMIPMIVDMASLQACVPTAPAWIADTM